MWEKSLLGKGPASAEALWWAQQEDPESEAQQASEEWPAKRSRVEPGHTDCAKILGRD